MSAEDRWLVLIDESADAEVYRIGALVMAAGQRRLLRADLDAVMARAEREFGIAATTELHGFEIYQGHGPWRALQPFERIQVYRWALEAIAFRTDALLFESVNRSAFRSRYAGPHRSEHEEALHRIFDVVQARAVEQRQAAFVYADQCRFAASVVRSLEESRQLRESGRAGSRLDRILRIVFVDSAANRQIQAVDLVTYLKQRIASDRDRDRARVARANARLWDTVADKVAHDRTWP